MSEQASTIAENGVLKDLNEVIRKLRDRQEAFANAARRARDADVERDLYQLATERQRFASELEEEVRGLGEQPATAGSITADLRRGLANLRSELVDEEIHPEFEECQLGEFLAVKDYESLLGRKLPLGIPSLLRMQLKRTRDALHLLRQLNRSS